MRAAAADFISAAMDKVVSQSEPCDEIVYVHQMHNESLSAHAELVCGWWCRYAGRWDENKKDKSVGTSSCLHLVHLADAHRYVLLCMCVHLI